MMKWKKWWTLGLTSILFFISVNMLFFPGVARSEYPERHVTIMVGMEAGGLTDILTRALIVGASRFLQQSIVIENKSGRAGLVAAGVVATARPDGYTLAALQNSSIIDFPLMNKVPFKPLRSFTPIYPNHGVCVVRAYSLVGEQGRTLEIL